MKTLKLSELKENTVYECALSGKKVLIINKSVINYCIDLRNNISVDIIHAQTYNEVNGYYDSITVFNNQLKEIEKT